MRAESAAGNESANTGEIVTWEDIEHVADDVFDVWYGSPEVAWAKLAWATLVAQGRTRYHDDIQRHLVLVQLFALSDLYRDFCCAAWDENTGLMLEDWAIALDMSTFRLAQCVGAEFYEFGEMTDEELVREALDKLTLDARPLVAGALLRGEHSTNELFLTMWLSNDAEYAGRPWSKLPDDVIESVLGDASDPGKLVAYGWIDDGMPLYRVR